MLSQLYKLNVQTDGRYATDAELQFLGSYVASFTVRQSAYQKLQTSERRIVQQVQAKVRQLDPGAFVYDNQDISSKCERDTLFVLRYSTLALLLNDTKLLEEQVLIWLQSIMRTFKDHQRRCDLTYRVMQEVVKQYLNPAEAALFCPILELNRSYLGLNN